MQTFLPYSSFVKTAKVLDYRRLGKQRVETLQILNALSGDINPKSGKPYGWSQHAATKMWRGYERCLVDYGLIICKEWIDRGYNDTCFDKILKYQQRWSKGVPPPWLGDPKFHLSHRSNLLRKDLDFYRQFFPNDPDDLPYIWPR